MARFLILLLTCACTFMPACKFFEDEEREDPVIVQVPQASTLEQSELTRQLRGFTCRRYTEPGQCVCKKVVDGTPVLAFVPCDALTDEEDERDDE